MSGGREVAIESSPEKERHSSSRLSFFLWLQSIRNDLFTGAKDSLEDLRQALTEKCAVVGLTRLESRLRSCLEILFVSKLTATDVSISDIRNLLVIHKAHTFNSSSSSQDHLAYVAYATLLVQLHESYTPTPPCTSDEYEENVERTFHDPVFEWSGVRGGPLVDQFGQYGSLATLTIRTREERSSAESVQDWDALLSYEAISSELRTLCQRSNGDIRNGQALWHVRRRFELIHAGITAKVTQLETVYLERLIQPHSQIDETAQLFSSFVTTNQPANKYEETMTRIYQVSSQAREAVASCETYEDTIESSGAVQTASIASRWQLWKQYTRWAASTSKGRQKSSKSQIDTNLVVSIFERALLQCGMVPCNEEELVSSVGPPLLKKELVSLRGNESRDDRTNRIEREKALLLADQTASIELWVDYMRFLGSSGIPAMTVTDVCDRARKAQPQNGDIHAAALRAMHRSGVNASSIESYFSSSLANEELRASGEQVANLFLGQIDLIREDAVRKRLESATSKSLQEALGSSVKDEGTFMDVYGFITFALDNLNSCASHDVNLRLEQVCSDWCLAGGEAYAKLADSVWQAAIALQPQNGLVWLYASRYYLALGEFKQAAQTIRRGMSQRDIESSKRVEMAELLLRICHLGGSLSEIDNALKCISDERDRVWTEYYASVSTQALAEQIAHPTTAPGDTVMNDEEVGAGNKRKTVSDDGSQGRRLTSMSVDDKKTRQGDTQLARDREFASIIVDNLPADFVERDVTNLFQDCGEILEVTGPRVLSFASGASEGHETRATTLVEFVSRESVPAARSKQFKVVKGHQIEVQMGYECTLYVTNFPASYDSDEAIRSLFKPFGRIFDVRWPSKKFVSTRRFCYVVFCNAGDVRQALNLHETELSDESGAKRIQVFLSNPHRKKVRSDAFNDEKELFVTGLSRAVSEESLRELFGPGVDHVRIPKHPDGRNRGIAYVDMSTVLDAQRVIVRSKDMDGGGYRINGKLLSVNPVEKKKKHVDSLYSKGGRTDDRLDVETRNRCLYLRGLPSDAQEPLIQQLVEHHVGQGTVRRIEWLAMQDNHGQALVEFTDAKYAGLATLSTEEMLYAETHPVYFSTLETRGAAASLVPRQAGKARRAGRGRGAPAFARNQIVSAREGYAEQSDMEMKSLSPSAPSQSTTSSKGQDAFREMLYKK